MSVPSSIDAALKRLASALDHLEAAAERQALAHAARGDAEEEFAILRDDRSRLALELDGAIRKLRRLEQASDEAIRRIDRANAAILVALGDDPAEQDDEPADAEQARES